MHPTYCDGVLTTEEGGVLQRDNLRIQAKKIIYTKREGEVSVYAEGNLLVDYGERALVGDSLFFDFLKNEGCLTNGKSAFPPWYLGGKKIALTACGDILIEEGYITTAEGQEKDVVLSASSIILTSDQILKMSNIFFTVNQVPFFFLPFLRLDVNQPEYETPLSITGGWGGYMGSYVSLRYHLYSWKNWDAYLRLDGYFKKGLGGGLETEYVSDVYEETLYTRSYFAHDISIDDPKKRDRYRFQGNYDFVTEDGRAWAHLLYDVLSDPEMANDFPPYDFDLGTACRTEIIVHKQEDLWLANFYTRVRVNSFQTINQDLPSLQMHLHPLALGYGIIGESLFRLGYHSYVFSDNVVGADPYRAGRFEAHPRLYRPFSLSSFLVTPEIGAVLIGYSNNPHDEAVGQALFDANVLATTSTSRLYGRVKHVVTPYIRYHLLSNPRVAVDNYFVFTIYDGYALLNVVRLGAKQAFFLSPLPPSDYHLFIDLWANAFLGHTEVPSVIPKGYVEIEFQPNPFLLFGFDGAWNFAHNLVDYANFSSDMTFSENLAFGFEARHRNRFDWRKADFYNFVLDAARSEERLLNSALSEKRNTLLAKIFYRFHPNWEAKFQVREGWDRILEPSYLEYQIDLATLLFNHYRLGFCYEKRQADHRVSFSFKLNPAPPRRRI